MAKEKKRYPSFDDIVFENRNKEYGATQNKAVSLNKIELIVYSLGL